MAILIGIAIALISVVGSFAFMGGHVPVIWQPAEYFVIVGSAVGIFIVATPFGIIRDTGRALVEVSIASVPKRRDYLDLLGLLYALMRELRNKGRGDVEKHIEDPASSALFQRYPKAAGNEELTNFICDYFRLIIMGNANTHEIEALMDEEIETMRHDKLKPHHALVMVGDALPALGIIAAVLGVIKAMGALDQSPQLLGGLIGAALVGTFAGIFLSYGLVSPIAQKIKETRNRRMRLFTIVKQSLLAFMNGALPQIAIEHGRKTIIATERPSIDDVEQETITGSVAANTVSGTKDPVPLQGAA